MPVLCESKLQPELIAERVGRAAADALRTEAWIAPKPGLVDRFDNGSHRDMDLHTFYRSAETIAPFLGRMAACGAEQPTDRLRNVFAQARRIGLEAEAAMFSATGGVNTHKGAIFTLGLMSTAYGYVSAFRAAGGGVWSGQLGAETLLQYAGCMVAGIVAEELAGGGAVAPDVRTAGQRLYVACGLTGIRGEAERGFPSILRRGLPALRQARQAGLDLDDAGVQVLLSLMREVEDTNLAARGGLAGLHYAQAAAHQALAFGGATTRQGKAYIEYMNRDFIDGNLSPGGSADLLAATLFLDQLLEGDSFFSYKGSGVLMGLQMQQKATGQPTLPGFFQGVQSGVSIAVGYMPIALAFGLLAKNTGISLTHTVGMSLLVFAGASQFMALGLLALSTGAVEIIFSTFIVNIRHLLMSMSINEKAIPESKLRRLIYAFAITDEVFAVASTREGTVGSSYLYGLGLTAYSSWVINSGIGYAAGSALPEAFQQGMSIALYAMFIGLLIPSVKKYRKALFLAAAAALLNSLFVMVLPAGWAIIGATIGAVLLLELVQSGRSTPAGEETYDR
jgi:4-azaleucine resistance transporter AzlC